MKPQLPLQTPSPLQSSDSDNHAISKQPSTRGANPTTLAAHTVRFVSESGVSGMPASQTVADRDTATWPHDDPSRPGWTFNGWFQGDVAYDFSKPVTTNLTLTARWGKEWSISPTSGPWQGGTQVNVRPPTDGVRFAQIIAGGGDSLALGSDGIAYAWGENGTGRVGDGTKIRRRYPVAVAMPAGVRFTRIALGTGAAAALDRDGHIWTWGGDDVHKTRGRSGDATRPGMVSMPAGVDRFTDISVSRHVMALDNQGQVWTWGSNYGGQLGHVTSAAGGTGNWTSDSIPGIVSGLPKVTNISAGTGHSMALSNTGQVWTWGDNLDNQLGRYANNNWRTQNPTPAPTLSMPKVVSISAGDEFSMALTSSGQVWTWGEWRYGELGWRTSNSRDYVIPHAVPSLTGVTEISAGARFSLAISGSSAYAWGDNYYGQQGTTTNNGVNLEDPSNNRPASIPARIPTPSGVTYQHISGSWYHTLAIGSDGDAYGLGSGGGELLGCNLTNLGYGAHPKVEAVWRGAYTTINNVTFDGRPSAGIPWRTHDGWAVGTPRHPLGTVPLTIGSTLGSDPQPDEISQRYTYTGTLATITFQSAHGNPTPQQQVALGDNVPLPDDPSESGWTFNGWFQGNVAYDFSKPVTGNLTLTAKWTKNNFRALPTRGPWQGGTQVNVQSPTDGVRFSQTVTSETHSMGLGSDGVVYAWGPNQYGELGDGTKNDGQVCCKASKYYPVPATMPADVRIIQLAASNYYSSNGFSMALDSKGRVWTWGGTNTGLLGRAGDATVPGMIPMPNGVTSFKAIGVNSRQAIALDQDGRIWIWGTSFREDPAIRQVTMPNGLTAVAIAGGGEHFMSIMSTGEVWTWGSDNYYGQLGTNNDNTSNIGSSRPVKVIGVPTATAVAAGRYHSMALTRNGEVWTWGDNRHAQLGHTTADSNYATTAKPIRVPGLSPATAISAGRDYSLAITSSGAYAWGDNKLGQQGTTTNNGSETGIMTPTLIPTTTDTTYVSVSSSAFSNLTYVTGDDGNTYNFGTGYRGDDSTGTSNGPSRVRVWRGTITTITDVLFGETPNAGEPYHGPDGWMVGSPRHPVGTVTLTVHSTIGGTSQPADTGQRFTYTGENVTVTFRTDHGTTPPTKQVLQGDTVPRPDNPTASGWTFDGWFLGDVAYDFNTPATTNLTLIARWSQSNKRWKISPTYGSDIGGETITLTPPTSSGLHYTQISNGDAFTLGLSSDGYAYAWGANYYGQIGDGTNSYSLGPTRVTLPANTHVLQVSARRDNALAVDTDGNVWTWGSNYYGQLGDPTLPTGSGQFSATPVKVNLPSGVKITQARVGGYYMLGIDSTGAVWTWGGTTAATVAPARVIIPKGAVITSIAPGDGHRMALDTDGKVWAWGSDWLGQLGSGTSYSYSSDTPNLVKGLPTNTSIKQISANGNYSVALDARGQAWAWGDNTKGQAGNGTVSSSTSPERHSTPTQVQTPTGTVLTSITTGTNHVVAIDNTGGVWTWGDNGSGQLGRTGETSKPGKVILPAGVSGIKAGAGGYHSTLIVNGGLLYAWGANGSSQLGTNDRDYNNHPTPSPAGAPMPPTPTRVLLDGTAVAGPTANPDGTWQVITPEHTVGSVPVTIEWSQGGRVQPDDTSNTYNYVHIGILPRAGGTGILLFLATGLMLVLSAYAERRRRATNTEHPEG